MHKEGILRAALTLLTLGAVAFIFSNSFLPGEASGANSMSVVKALENVLSHVGIQVQISEFFVRKAAHFLEFMLLGVLLMGTLRMYTPRPSRHVTVALFSGLFVAVLDEWIQLYVPGRGSSVEDVLLDFGGLCFGVLLFFAVWWLQCAHRRRKLRRRYAYYAVIRR